MPLPLQPTDYELNAAGLQRSEFVTANCFYRRAALAAAGGFDERFRAPWREDSDLYLHPRRALSGGSGLAACLGCAQAAMMLMAGLSGVFLRAPNAIVFHPDPPCRLGSQPAPTAQEHVQRAALQKASCALPRSGWRPLYPGTTTAASRALLATASLCFRPKSHRCAGGGCLAVSGWPLLPAAPAAHRSYACPCRRNGHHLAS